MEKGQPPWVNKAKFQHHPAHRQKTPLSSSSTQHVASTLSFATVTGRGPHPNHMPYPSHTSQRSVVNKSWTQVARPVGMPVDLFILSSSIWQISRDTKAKPRRQKLSAPQHPANIKHYEQMTVVNTTFSDAWLPMALWKKFKTKAHNYCRIGNQKIKRTETTQQSLLKFWGFKNRYQSDDVFLMLFVTFLTQVASAPRRRRPPRKS